MRSVRIDDFPHGDLRLFLTRDRIRYRELVEKTLNVFEQYKVPYILGATPQLLQEGDIEFLNKVVKGGKVVMHGFTHGWDFPDWSNVVSCWEHGGEFASHTRERVQECYSNGLTTLQQVNSFCEEDFIPPFNCYTQTVLDVLKDTNVKRIHTCDKEWDAYNYNKLEHYNIEPVISKYGVTYSGANAVVNNLSDTSQITLHWCYDAERMGWEEDYHTLCKELIK